MIHQFDHRYANAVESETQTKSAQASELIKMAQKDDPDTEAEPRYWVPQDSVVPLSRAGTEADLGRLCDLPAKKQ